MHIHIYIYILSLPVNAISLIRCNEHEIVCTLYHTNAIRTSNTNEQYENPSLATSDPCNKKKIVFGHARLHVCVRVCAWYIYTFKE